jgi:predicted ATP-grasp superfamily ATP-dependent carboligase
VASEHVVWLRRPVVRGPVIIAAFEGWNDAGEAASTAARHLAEVWDAQPFASIDPENFYDFTSTRPEVVIVDGFRRKIEWPANDFASAEISGTQRDVIICLGTEPQLKWRTFAEAVLEVAQTTGAELVISLGALLADVPHSRPTRVTGTSVDDALIQRFGLVRSRYEGPTGIVGVLHDTFADHEIPSCSLWATVPHYLPSTTSPKAALALVERLAEMLAVAIPTIELEIGAVDYERQVNDVVDTDDEMRGFVRTLEEGYDENDGEEYEEYDAISSEDDDEDGEADPRTAFMKSDGKLPTGDDLADELEQFLREQ